MMTRGGVDLLKILSSLMQNHRHNRDAAGTLPVIGGQS